MQYSQAKESTTTLNPSIPSESLVGGPTSQPCNLKRLVRSKSKVLREGDRPHSIAGRFGTVEIEEYDLRFMVMVGLLWSDR